MNLARDPKHDPIPGDQLEKIGKRWNMLRQVDEVSELGVTYSTFTEDYDPCPGHFCTLKSWRRWAKTGRVDYEYIAEAK
jgi:hypothetical protein